MIDKLKKISDAIDFCIKEKNITLVYDSFGNNNCACALGCLLIQNNIDLDINPSSTEFLYKEVSKTLDVPEYWIDAFIAGFDNTPWYSGWSTDPNLDRNLAEEANNAGIEFRKRYNPINYNNYKKLPSV